MSTLKRSIEANSLLELSRYLKPMISICIPTFNRCEYLDYLLANIFLEVDANSEMYEVVVSDNCSTDKTLDVVRKFQDKSLNLRYSRSYKNFGADRNIRNSIMAASGRFCWIMGDDDAFRQGALGLVAKYLETHNPDISISDRYMCDLELNVLSYTPFIIDDAPFLIFDCLQRENMIEYFQRVKSTIGMFNFISILVVRRSSWLSAPEAPGMSQSIFPHIYKIIDMMRNQGAKLLFINEPTVFARDNPRMEEITGNSEFRNWQVHFKGNIEIADHFFSDDPVAYSAFLSPIKNIISPAIQHYLILAEKEDSTVEALLTLKKLGIEYT